MPRHCGAGQSQALARAVVVAVEVWVARLHALVYTVALPAGATLIDAPA